MVGEKIYDIVVGREVGLSVVRLQWMGSNKFQKVDLVDGLIVLKIVVQLLSVLK